MEKVKSVRSSVKKNRATSERERERRDRTNLRSLEESTKNFLHIPGEHEKAATTLTSLLRRATKSDSALENERGDSERGTRREREEAHPEAACFPGASWWLVKLRGRKKKTSQKEKRMERKERVVLTERC